MTPREFNLRFKAWEIGQLEKERDIHLQAFLNQAVQATTGAKRDKPKYRTFSDFFNYEKLMKEITDNQPKKSKDSKLADLILKANRKRGDDHR